ncbi:type VII secretion target [Lentzea sp. NBRC 102530]|uniref:WXG100 family type VII secretion target n=1 Tax=Lentzea sp. NBRC 102530 TaxID=3032201 RepID=UPI002552CE54|nr:type VII secretion target [Lentzea sp. NBRC 102530]
MAENFYLDPEGLTSATSKLRSAGDALSRALDELTRKVAENDGCWGSDHIGEAFAKNYVQKAKDLQDGAAGARDGAVQMADLLRQANTAFQDTDAESARKLDQTMSESFAQSE